ncbi:hypothetical protein VNI00_018993, partial [Paramarasmius palmivorus]
MFDRVRWTPYNQLPPDVQLRLICDRNLWAQFKECYGTLTNDLQLREYMFETDSPQSNMWNVNPYDHPRAPEPLSPTSVQGSTLSRDNPFSDRPTSSISARTRLTERQWQKSRRIGDGSVSPPRTLFNTGPPSGNVYRTPIFQPHASAIGLGLSPAQPSITVTSPTPPARMVERPEQHGKPASVHTVSDEGSVEEQVNREEVYMGPPKGSDDSLARSYQKEAQEQAEIAYDKLGTQFESSTESLLDAAPTIEELINMAQDWDEETRSELLSQLISNLVQWTQNQSPPMSNGPASASLPQTSSPATIESRIPSPTITPITREPYFADPPTTAVDYEPIPGFLVKEEPIAGPSSHATSLDKKPRSERRKDWRDKNVPKADKAPKESVPPESQPPTHPE